MLVGCFVVSLSLRVAVVVGLAACGSSASLLCSCQAVKMSVCVEKLVALQVPAAIDLYVASKAAWKQKVVYYTISTVDAKKLALVLIYR